ncbi:MAG: winged helix-turn-helix transcriptional regulator [Calditrichaeota bacterium]|nr:winged helix-turn-helix transcriptional regulator [Calditrichota bacterium]
MNEKELCDIVYVHEDRVDKARLNLLDKQDLATIAEFYKILGDPTRLKICLAIAHESLCVCDLSRLLDMTDSAISHQLRLLKQARIVSSEKSGKMVYYTLADKHIYDIITNTKAHLQEEK